MWTRIKKACNTNEPQVSAVVLLTLLNLLACSLSIRDLSWWEYGIAVLFYPVLAFISNLISPIPKD